MPWAGSAFGKQVLRLLQARWSGYGFGLAAVLLLTVLLELLAPGRVANASALFTIPVLLTAAAYGRGPALLTSVAAFLCFVWFFATPVLDPTHVPTLAVFLLISVVAGQLATTLRHQVEVARQREREALALYDMARQVHGSTLDLQPVLGLILDQLKVAVGYDSAALLLQDDDIGAAVVVEYRGPLPRESVVGYRATPGSPAGAFHETVRRRSEPVILESISRAEWRFADAALPDEPYDQRAVLGVPLIVKASVIGMLTLLRSSKDSFTARQAELAMIFAQQVAVAIENARLYEDTRDKATLEERQRLARELHDSVSQQLYGIALNASTAEELFDSKPERARGLIGDVLRLAEAGLVEMRALIFELRPESLELEGLVGALEKQAAALQARHGLEVRLDLGGEPNLPPRTKEVLYRVAQEALHNAAKHARAHVLDLTLDVSNGEVRLVVADDGRGFDAQQEFPGHLGLRSMRERAAAVGGTVEIESSPGAGARVSALVPLATRV